MTLKLTLGSLHLDAAKFRSRTVYSVNYKLKRQGPRVGPV